MGSILLAIGLVMVTALLGYYAHDRRSRRIAETIAQRCPAGTKNCFLSKADNKSRWHGEFWRDWTLSFVWTLGIVFICVEIFWIVATPGLVGTLGNVHWKAAMTVGGFCLVVLLGYILSRHDLPRHVWLLVGIGAFLLIVLFWYSSWTIPAWANATTQTWSWAERPGSGFVFVLGFITVTGFILTISQLHETNARITDYTTLLRRLRRLLIEAHAWQTDGESGSLWARICVWLDKLRELDAGSEPVRIYVRTLALGSMSTDPNMFRRYVDALKGIQCEHSKWHLIQFDHEELSRLSDGARQNTDTGRSVLVSELSGDKDVQRLYSGFLNRQFSVTQVANGYTSAIKLSALFARHVDPPSRQITVRPAGDGNLPDYSLFVTGRRAIVITALDVPIGENSKPRGVGAVHVVAVETTSRQVIGELIKTFESIAEVCNHKNSTHPSTTE